MSIDDRTDPDLDIGSPDDRASGPAQTSPWLVRGLAVLVAISLLVAGGAIAVIFGLGSAASDTAPSESSVDVGFSRDMTAHHRQAVEMASWVRDHTTDPTVRILAFDIENTQLTQIGQLQGLLVAWNRPQFGGERMAWMHGSGDHMAGMQIQPNGLMPGMATDAEMATLQTLSGEALDVYFLQLMLRHHQGGVPMAQYAAEHAGTAGVREIAAGMAKAQANEIVQMEQMLRERNASPLPAPA